MFVNKEEETSSQTASCKRCMSKTHKALGDTSKTA